ncbi:MAG: rhomboid family intramembrane serine protease [Dehalococcoidales bacterium]
MRFRDPRSINLTPLWVLIAVNVLVFIATSISSGSITNVSLAIANQAGVNSATIASQPWTIVSALFIHDGIFHILFNMLTLYFFGMYVLALVGETRFFLVYFIGGIVGNALFMLLAPNSIAVGASGAIFALGGVLAVLVPRLKVMIFPIPVPVDLWISILISFLVLTFVADVAWQAHLGGLLTGLAAGYIFRRQARRRRY